MSTLPEISTHAMKTSRSSSWTRRGNHRFLMWKKSSVCLCETFKSTQVQPIGWENWGREGAGVVIALGTKKECNNY
jgi:hypothetical protein